MTDLLPESVNAAITRILNYLADEEHDYRAYPTGTHIYHSIAVTQQWLLQQQITQSPTAHKSQKEA